MATRRSGRFRERMRVRMALGTMALAVAPVLTVALLVGRWTYENDETQSLRIEAASAAAAEAEIRSVLVDVETELQLLDDVVAIGDLSPAAQGAALRNLLSNNRIYQRIVLVDDTLQPVALASRTGLSVLPDELDPAVLAVAESAAPGRTTLGAVTVDPALREALAPLGHALIDRRTGQVEHVAVATIRFEVIRELLAALTRGNDDDVYVVADDGRIVAHRDPAVVLRGTVYDLPAEDGRHAGFRGDDAVVAMTTLAFGDSMLTVVAERPASVALEVANRSVSTLVAATVIAALLAGLAALVMSRRVVQPLEDLAASAHRIAEGEFTQQVEIRRGGEIGQLGDAFNTMARRLDWTIGSLEAQVASRTAELREAAEVQEQLIAQLEQQASHDYLTGLPNRANLDERLDIELARARRHGGLVGLLLIDLDLFKEVNDTFGHPVGDELLVAVAERLDGELRDVDALCRLGGDEFAVVVPDLQSTDDVRTLADRLVAAFREAFVLSSQEVFSAASIGIAVSEPDGTSRAELVQRADLALYSAKDAGRNGYAFFDPAMDVDVRRRAMLGQRLQGAADRGELFLRFQPQVSLAARQVVGVEALVRWQHPTLGALVPSDFVPVAEATGLIDEIGAWVLRSACVRARRWQVDGLATLPVSVNVSTSQLRSAGFTATVAGILRETALPPACLEVELTESALVDAEDQVEVAIQGLHDLGVGITLDDFGSGHASLNYVRRHHFDKLKIDQSFVHDVLVDPRSSAVVTSMVDLAARLDLVLVAEGVESVDILDRLRADGIDVVQGYHVSEPVDADAIDELLTIGSDRIRRRDLPPAQPRPGDPGSAAAEFDQPTA